MNEPALKHVADAVAVKRQWAEKVLAEWVRCPSTLGNELSAQEYIERIFSGMGLEVRREPVTPDIIEPLSGYSPRLLAYCDRPNIVGEHRPAAGAGRSLIVNGHVDVVSPEPAALWSTPPFSTKVFTDAEGETWMQGRGAGDMKGGTVSALWAFEALRVLELEPAAPLTFQSCIEEECTGNGTLSLLANGGVADACLIPEPFDQTVLIEQAGVLWFEIHILGKTTHVLGTQQGVNAIEKAWHIYCCLKEQLEAPANRPEVLPPGYRSIDHPVNLNLGVIQGGDWPSTVAGDCVMRLRMGLLPGTSCDEIMDRIEKVVSNAGDGDPWLLENRPKVVFKGFKAEPCRFDATSDFATTLSRCHKEVSGEDPVHLHATCTTDVRFFNLYAGVPATCYGPKAVAIHGADERVSIDSMERTALVIARFMMQWCGVTKRGGTS
jgi:acetylornithine deacetylase